MSTCAPFHTQLASIMEVLVNAAVAEISVLVDEGYALLHLEISRGQKEISRSQMENHVLKERLQIMEMGNQTGPGSGPVQAFEAHISKNHLTVNVNTESDRSSVGQDQDVINLCSDGEHSPSYKEESDPVMVSSISLNELMENERVSPELIHIKEERLEDEFDTINAKGEVTICGVEHLVESCSDEDKRDTNGHTETGHRIEDYDQDVRADRDRKSTIQRPHPVTPSEHNVKKRRYPSYNSIMNNRPPNSDSEGSTCSSAAEVSPSYVTAHTKQQQMFVTDESVMDRFFNFESRDVKQEAVMLGPESCEEESQSNRDASKETVHKENSISNKGSDYFGNLAERRLLNSHVKSGGKTAEPKRAHQYMSNLGHRGQHIISKREKRYICRFCGKSFTCPKYLQSHLRVHTGEKPFSCSYCGKRFGQAGYLKKHQNVHTGEKPFACLLCGKRFADSSNLIRHKSVHAGERPFICIPCGERFASKHNLRIHQKRNHSVCSSHADVLSPSIS